MLTFFDYLRRRSYESVLAGVHEALESLENDDHSAPSDDKKPAQLASSPSPHEPDEPSEANPLPPRRRGRPPKKRASNL